jgi:hypothetical protein
MQGSKRDGLDKSKGSLTEKLKRASWNDDFMPQLQNQIR